MQVLLSTYQNRLPLWLTILTGFKIFICIGSDSIFTDMHMSIASGALKRTQAGNYQERRCAVIWVENSTVNLFLFPSLSVWLQDVTETLACVWHFAQVAMLNWFCQSMIAYIADGRNQITNWFRNAWLIHTLLSFCSGSFLSISVSLVNDTISFVISDHFPLSTRVKILFQSSLQSHCHKIISAKSSLPDNRYKLFATVRILTKVSLYFFYIYVVYLWLYY